jgi:hypothetical protein
VGQGNAARDANQALQQTGHANDGLSSFTVFSRVSRLLSWVG